MQPYEKYLKGNSQKLRVDQTDAERKLWQRINRDQLLGFRFNRQKPLLSDNEENIMKQHTYQTTVEWVGNLGRGTSSYTAYERDFIASALNKPNILGSADPAFRGDKTRWNPEDMLLASISACHKLWYLHFCAVNNIIVQEYRDEAIAIMDEGSSEHAGCFISATLKPRVRISSESDAVKALALHENAHQACFIANSLNFPVKCEAVIEKD